MISFINSFIAILSILSLMFPAPTSLESFNYNIPSKNMINIDESKEEIRDVLNNVENYFNINYKYYDNDRKITVVENLYTKENSNDKDKVVMNLYGVILDVIYDYDETVDFVPIRDIISGSNLFYAKTTKEKKYDVDYTDVKIYDAKKNEIIKRSRYSSSAFTVPVCSIGNFLIFENNYADSQYSIEAYTTHNDYLIPAMLNAGYNGGVKIKYNENYSIKYKNKKVYLTFERVVPSKDENDDLNKNEIINFTYVFENNLTRSKYLPFTYDDTIRVDGEDYLLVHKVVGADNTTDTENFITTYNLLKMDDDYTTCKINMGECVTYIDIDNIKENTCKITKNGINYLYNIKSNTLVENLDNKKISYNKLSNQDHLYNMHYFDDGILFEIENENKYRLVDENNVDLGVYSDKPILMYYKYKKTKGSMLIREKVLDKNKNTRYLYRTFDKNKFSGIYEDEFYDLLYYPLKEVWDNTNTQMIGFYLNNGDLLNVDLLNGTSLLDNTNRNYDFFPIGDEIYYAELKNQQYILHNIKNPDTPALTLDLTKEYYQVYLRGDIIAVNNTDKNEGTNNSAYFVNKKLEVTTKNTLNDLFIKKQKIGKRNFYYVECTGSNDNISKKEFYDDNFKLIIDNLISGKIIDTKDNQYINFTYKNANDDLEAFTLDENANEIKILKNYSNTYILNPYKYLLFEDVNNTNKNILTDKNFNILLSSDEGLNVNIFNDYIFVNDKKNLLIDIYDKNFVKTKTIYLNEVNDKLDENKNRVSSILYDKDANLIEITFENIDGNPYTNEKPNNIIINKELKAYNKNGYYLKYFDGIYINKEDDKIYHVSENMDYFKEY